MKIYKYKIKSFTRKIVKWISIYIRFPHLWVAIIVLIFSVIALLISMYLNTYETQYWSSIFANIFAGLLTGLIICLVSGVKQISIVQLKSKKQFLEELTVKIEQYRQKYDGLRSKTFVRCNEIAGLYEFVYDVGVLANDVNSFVKQASFDETLAFKPIEYCKKYLNYDALALTDVYQDLHDNLWLVEAENPSKKEICQYFDVVNRKLWDLNHAAYRKIRELDVQLEAINRSLL